jgi:hypothetical protein
VGDQLLLKLHSYALQSVIITYPFLKLVFKFFGPYEVVKIGKAAYHLNLPEVSLVHPVFHMSQLKPFTPKDTPVFSDLTASVDLSACSCNQRLSWIGAC